MSLDNLRRQCEFDFIASGERTKRILIQRTQTRPFDDSLVAVGAGADRYLACSFIGLTVLYRTGTQPLKGIGNLEYIKIALNPVRRVPQNDRGAALVQIRAHATQYLIHFNSGLFFQVYRLSITNNCR